MGILNRIQGAVTGGGGGRGSRTGGLTAQQQIAAQKLAKATSPKKNVSKKAQSASDMQRAAVAQAKALAAQKAAVARKNVAKKASSAVGAKTTTLKSPVKVMGKYSVPVSPTTGMPYKKAVAPNSVKLSNQRKSNLDKPLDAKTMGRIARGGSITPDKSKKKGK